jgi:hypothetical protein
MGASSVTLEGDLRRPEALQQRTAAQIMSTQEAKPLWHLADERGCDIQQLLTPSCVSSPTDPCPGSSWEPTPRPRGVPPELPPALGYLVALQLVSLAIHSASSWGRSLAPCGQSPRR